MLKVQIRSEPVENRHKIVANALYADLSAVDYVLSVVSDEFITRRLAEFNIFVDRNGLDYFHFKPRFLIKAFQPFEFFYFPNFADGNVLNGGDHARHSLNLLYVIKRYAIFFAIPTKC